MPKVVSTTAKRRIAAHTRDSANGVDKGGKLSQTPKPGHRTGRPAGSCLLFVSSAAPTGFSLGRVSKRDSFLRSFVC